MKAFMEIRQWLLTSLIKEIIPMLLMLVLYWSNWIEWMKQLKQSSTWLTSIENTHFQSLLFPHLLFTTIKQALLMATIILVQAILFQHYLVLVMELLLQMVLIGHARTGRMSNVIITIWMELAILIFKRTK